MQDRLSQKLIDQLEFVFERLPKKIAIRLKRLLADPANYQTFGLWTSAVIAGAVAVLYAKLFQYAEKAFHRILEWSPYAALILSPLLFVAAWLVVRKYAPEAAGSGIPQIMVANETEYVGTNRKTVDRLLSLRTAGVKILSSLLCVVGGGAIGREGPTLQIAASVFHFFGRQVRRITPTTNETTWVVAGAAAGLASAFNTPLGGIVYAIEELGISSFQKFRSAILGGVIVAGLVAQWFLGSYLYLGFPVIGKVKFSILPAAIACGLIAGILGALFGRLLLVALNRRLAMTKTSRLVVITVLCGLAMAGLAILDPRSSGTGVQVIDGFLFEKDTASSALVAIRYFGTAISYLSGAAGGIFSPSLAIGATVGSYLSQFIGTQSANLMVLLGMIGFLTGVTRTPFTAFILVLEMTDRHSAIFPMMLTALTAMWISQVVDRKSFYEHVKEKFKATH